MEALPARNNTNFSLALQEVVLRMPSISLSKERNKGDAAGLETHQRVVHDYFVGSGVRGFYAMHRMGAGKTRLAVSIAETMLDRGMRVIFLAAKTLHDNFRQELRVYLTAAGVPEAEHAAREARYHFVSSNASNMLEQLQRPELLEISLENTLLIVDEAHEFVNSITNASKNATALYHNIMESRTVRLLFLSGTPVINDPYELGLAFNMLVGPLPQGRTSTTLFGEEYRRFTEYFVDVPSATELDGDAKEGVGRGLKNREKFINRILGLVSYYDPRQCEDAPAGKAHNCLAHRFPEALPLEVVRVPMSGLQYSRYRLARTQEREEEARRFGPAVPAPLTKGASDSSSTYRILSRQLGNYLYPEHAGTLGSVKGRLHYARDLDKLRRSDFTAAALMEHSPKLAVLLRNVLRHLPWAVNAGLREIMAAADVWVGAAKKHPTPGPGIVYSQFKDSGAELVAAALRAHGWEEITAEMALSDKLPPPGPPRLIVLSGSLTPEERTALLRVRNAPGNEEGRRVALLCITEVAARGINTRGSTHVHQMESYWNYSRTEQVVARADRLDSHVHLPAGQRKVHAYLYLALPPKTADDPEEVGTDEYLYLKALRRLQVNGTFISACRAASIDCVLWSATFLKGRGLRCHLCAPTNQGLFVPDLALDMEAPNPCRSPQERRVRAEVVKVADREYHWYRDAGRLHILQYQPNLGAYLPLPLTHPDYGLVLEVVDR